MIRLPDYWRGNDALYPLAMGPDIERNALCAIDLANRLITLAKGAGVVIREMPSGGVVSGGWMPAAVSAAENEVPTSKHLTGQAIDLYDPQGRLDMWLHANQNVLKDLGLWLESPDDTPNWSHVQSVPPPCKSRVFRARPEVSA